MKDNDLVIVSGAQPTGPLHIGNWAGMLRNCVTLQEEHPGQCLFFIADYHSLTIEYDPKEKRAQVLDLAASMLALGIDPKKAILFVQSDVPEVTECAWIFSTVTPVAEMERMTQFKDKSSRDAKNINMGLMSYPILQAVDIVLYGGNAVPVGEDQVQHVETTRVIARNFNKRFGETFPEPKALLTATPRVMSLVDPSKKMSKSHGEKSYLALDDDPETILKKLKGVPTEPSGTVTKELLRTNAYAGVELLFDLLDLVGANDVAEAALKAGHVRYGDFKQQVAEAIAKRFEDYRLKKKELLNDPQKVWEILADGGKQARVIAVAKMEEVRKKTGLR